MQERATAKRGKQAQSYNNCKSYTAGRAKQSSPRAMSGKDKKDKKKGTVMRESSGNLAHSSSR